MNKKRIFVFGGLCLLGLVLITGGAIAVIMGGNLNLGNYKIVNLATPTDNLDGANKGYVDAQAGGGGGGLWENCYLLTTSQSNADCDAGYTAVLSSKGNGCGLTTGYSTGITKGLFYKYRLSAINVMCDGAPTADNRRFECIDIWPIFYSGGGTGTPLWQTTGLGLNSYCSVTGNSSVPSTSALCCK